MKIKKKKNQRKSQRHSVVYNKLPTKVTRKEFNTFIKPHLSLPVRGPKPKLSYWKIFNHILFTLHTGIQWENLPTKNIHWSTVYKRHNRWSKDGSYERIFNSSLDWLSKEDKLDLLVLHGDGSNVVAKKGARR
jgi:transposase